MANHNPILGDLMKMAERELSAFMVAVTELFGAEQAAESADHWLLELEARNDLPVSTREWRTLTVAAAARLANRVTASARSKDPHTQTTTPSVAG